MDKAVYVFAMYTAFFCWKECGDMRLFHGTTEENIERLEPVSKDREGKPVAFLTDVFAYSLFYIRDREIDFVTCGVRTGGKVHYDEKFPDQLRVLYAGRAGWVYEAEAQAEKHTINGIWLCRESCAVVKKHFVADAYEAIMKEIEKGNVEVRRYEDATEEEKALDREGMVLKLRGMRNMSEKCATFYREHFAECWEIAHAND